MKFILTLCLTMCCCFVLGQSQLPSKQDIERAINLTINQKMTEKNSSCEYGQCGDWWTANKDSIFYKSDTLKFYNSSNIVFNDNLFCNSLIWDFNKENAFTVSQAQMCQEPPTRTIGTSLSGQKNTTSPNKFDIISKDNFAYIIIYADQTIFNTYKVVDLKKTTQKNLGDKSFCMILVRQ